MNAVHFENKASSVRLKTLLFTKTLGGYFMQAIVETVFDACYLIGVVTLGILMIAKSHGNKQYRLFGIMAVVLGFGDAFHLVPRAVALCTTGMAIARIVLCLFPQNAWTSSASPLSWGIYRNIPFTIMGLIIIYLFYKSSREQNDKLFKNMWLTIVISFGFYLPVVLFADLVPIIGMLMIPKTLAYVWTVWIGYHAMKAEQQ